MGPQNIDCQLYTTINMDWGMLRLALICEVHTVYLYIYILFFSLLKSRELVEPPPFQHEEQSFLGGRLWLIYAEVNNSWVVVPCGSFGATSLCALSLPGRTSVWARPVESFLSVTHLKNVQASQLCLRRQASIQGPTGSG